MKTNDGPPRGNLFSTFITMVWQGIVLGTILGTVGPGRKPDQEYMEKVMVRIWAIIFATFVSMVWPGIVFGIILGKMRPVQNLIRNMLKSYGPFEGRRFLNCN